MLETLSKARRWHRRGRAWAVALALALPLLTLPAVDGVCPTAHAQSLRDLPDTTRPIELTVHPLPHFQASSPSRTRFGKLEFRGGLVLSSRESAFGGWSGIAVEANGRRFLALSDEGTWMSGEIGYSGSAPTAIAGARMGPIRALRGRQLDKKRDLDAEALALLDGSLARGTVLIGFERNHRIGVFPVANGELAPPTQYLALPAEARRMKANKGFEAVAVVQGGPLKGAVVAFSERYPGDPSNHTGWIWIKQQPHQLTLADHGGFEVTDAASLPDGTLLVLERRFRWTEGVKMRIRSIAADAVKPGAALDGEILIEADLSFQIDNMEGLATHRGPAGETILTLISDNNFNTLLQRTLLLQFALPDERRAAGGR